MSDLDQAQADIAGACYSSGSYAHVENLRLLLAELEEIVGTEEAIRTLHRHLVSDDIL